MNKTKSIFLSLIGISLIFIGGIGFIQVLLEIDNRVYSIPLKKDSFNYEQTIVPVSNNIGLVGIASSIIIFAGVQLIKERKND
jgi:Trk-type K+ transport system membrane component